MNRLIRPDDIDHGDIDPGVRHRLRPAAIQQGAVHGDPELRKIALQTLDGGIIAVIRHFVPAVGAAR